jgi:hypothetical protein
VVIQTIWDSESFLAWNKVVLELRFIDRYYPTYMFFSFFFNLFLAVPLNIHVQILNVELSCALAHFFIHISCNWWPACWSICVLISSWTAIKRGTRISSRRSSMIYWTDSMGMKELQIKMLYIASFKPWRYFYVILSLESEGTANKSYEALSPN